MLPPSLPGLGLFVGYRQQRSIHVLPVLRKCLFPRWPCMIFAMLPLGNRPIVFNIENTETFGKRIDACPLLQLYYIDSSTILLGGRKRFPLILVLPAEESCGAIVVFVAWLEHGYDSGSRFAFTCGGCLRRGSQWPSAGTASRSDTFASCGRILRVRSR